MKKYAPWLTLAAAVAAMIVAMKAMGRFWICECGRILLWSSDAWSSDNSQHLFDPYAFSHIEHGIFFFVATWYAAKKLTWQWRFAIVMAMEAAWEAVENSPLIIDRYRTATAALGYTGDTVINSLGDLLAAALGFFVIQQYGWRWAAVTVIVVELALLLTIRDNLFLNILMLLFPAPAIQEWQSAGR